MDMSRLTISAAAFAVMGVAALAYVGTAAPEAPASGVEKGAALPAYHPAHVTGPDKGTSTCPVCKYPRNPAVQAWINSDDDKNVAALVAALEKVAKANADARFKAFVVFANPKREAADAISARLKRIGDKLGVEHVALAYLPGPDDPAVKGYGVSTDPKVRNTIFVYRNRTVDAKFVNFTADDKGIGALNEAIRKVL